MGVRITGGERLPGPGARGLLEIVEEAVLFEGGDAAHQGLALGLGAAELGGDRGGVGRDKRALCGLKLGGAGLRVGAGGLELDERVVEDAALGDDAVEGGGELGGVELKGGVAGSAREVADDLVEAVNTLAPGGKMEEPGRLVWICWPVSVVVYWRAVSPL